MREQQSYQENLFEPYLESPFWVNPHLPPELHLDFSLYNSQCLFMGLPTAEPPAQLTA